MDTRRHLYRSLSRASKALLIAAAAAALRTVAEHQEAVVKFYQGRIRVAADRRACLYGIA